ncbi:DUF3089 domain-containing protein [Frankia sp. CNm7]|uniref:DUF3089 domain-containing protein n=1 Tax=Frankia nepalensis TaxID=1836974 RepID=UPI00193311F5|nr:DUF3089 domain-containing protein [Frankia nepalensis]MBL7522909.1 DUF3089 domain-containing protein [Frankia nepalensis]
MRRCSASPLAVLTPLLTLLLVSACARPGDEHPSTSPTSTQGPSISADVAVAHPTVWVCRPGTVNDNCAFGLDTTVVGPIGSPSIESFQAASKPPLDCFYVYPTVSRAPLANAPLRATPTEIAVVRAQAARFATTCRVFAPVYQQYTVVSRLQPGGPADDSRDLAFADVRSAWNDYLLNDNDGRPVVLVGDDQGAEMLLRLLREQIEPDASQRALLVSALLVGADVRVPRDALVGGDLAVLPACQRHDEFGCVVAFSAYRGDAPADAWFGRPAARSRGHDAEVVRALANSDLRVLCTNPAALGGGAAELSPYLPTAQVGGALLPGRPAGSLPAEQTGFVTYPGRFFAECRQAGDRSWLAVTPRPGSGDPMPTLNTPASWGLHFAEFNLALGDLTTLVHRQATAYLNARAASTPVG